MSCYGQIIPLILLNFSNWRIFSWQCTNLQLRTYINLHKSEWKVCQWFLGKLPRTWFRQLKIHSGVARVHTKFFCSRMVAQNVLQTKVFLALFWSSFFVVVLFRSHLRRLFVAAHWRRILELVAVKRVFISFCKSQVFIFL